MVVPPDCCVPSAHATMPCWPGAAWFAARMSAACGTAPTSKNRMVNRPWARDQQRMVHVLLQIVL